MFQGGVKGISGGKLDSGVMNVVLEDDESDIHGLVSEEGSGTRMGLPSIQEGSVSKDALESLVGLFSRDDACSNLPIVGIKFAGGGGAGPHNGDETHGQRNGTNSVICDRGQGLALSTRKVGYTPMSP